MTRESSDTGIKDLIEIDRLIHEPARLVICAILGTVKEADFLYLLRETGLTKGNLSSHLTRLEDAGYVAIEKTFDGKTPRTICALTEEGQAAWLAYRERLKTAFDTLSA